MKVLVALNTGIIVPSISILMAPPAPSSTTALPNPEAKALSFGSEPVFPIRIYVASKSAPAPAPPPLIVIDPFDSVTREIFAPAIK